MRIAIDASAIPRLMAGAGVYTYELVRALAAVNDRHRLIILARPGLFDDLAARTKRLHVVHVRPSSRPGRLFWEQTVLPVLLRRLRVDVLHSPHHHTPALAPGVRRVVTIHDVTFMLLPDRYPLSRRLYMETLTRASARVADAIITPSQVVRDEVVERLGVPAERVVVIPYAAAPQFTPVDEPTIEALRQKYRLPDRYVLSVGSLEPGKNRARLFLAYARLRAEGLDDCPLVVVGQPAWRYERDVELTGGLGLRDLVRYLGYVPSEDLPGLYSGATLFAFPSLYEGFGLPVLEAMACGTPVVASSTSAIPEVAGDAALLIDPRDADAIAEAMSRLLADEVLLGQLRARGLERASRFSWERTARDTLSVYEVVAAEG
jgi:glycosyltransferase involved in cell wall biosynthesis